MMWCYIVVSHSGNHLEYFQEGCLSHGQLFQLYTCEKKGHLQLFYCMHMHAVIQTC